MAQRGRRGRTLRDSVYEEIRRQILEAEIQPGSPLSEYELAEGLQVSRTPVREALMDLGAAGLIRSIPRYGMFVAQMTAQDIHEVYELRIPLESLAARIAARSLSDSAVLELQGDLQQEGEALTAGDFEVAFERGANLHRRLRAATRNVRLQTLLQNLHDQAHLIRHVAGGTGDRPRLTFDEHTELVDAIAARNPDRAASAMANHLALARANALALVTPTSDAI